MLKIILLASGGLGQKVLIHFVSAINFDLACVLTDSNSTGIIECCTQNKIPFFAGNPRQGKGYQFMKEFSCDILISVNYLFLIEKDIIDHPEGIAFNVHGSLLPKYRGRTPHVWAIINGETETGITAHLIDEGCDTGAILEQIKIPIGKNDTGASILNQFGDLYIPLIERVIEKYKTKKLNSIPQNETEATFFGKRTPESGMIDWSWEPERIYNWVRAQAYPYPGAFTFLDDEKIVINKVEIVKYISVAPNKYGAIIDGENGIEVICNGGTLRILEYSGTKLNIKSDQKFHV